MAIASHVLEGMGRGRVESNLLLVLLLLGVSTGSGGLGALALDTAVTSSTVRRGEGEVDVLLWSVCAWRASRVSKVRRDWRGCEGVGEVGRVAGR